MFGAIDKSKGLLFVTHDLDHSIQLTLQKMQQEVEGLDENRLLNTPPEDLKRDLVEKYGITPITLQRDQWYADYEDVPVDVRHDPMRWIDDRSRPVMVAGERVEVRIPFEGERELFYAKANTYSLNPPRAVIEKNEVVLRYDTPADQPRDIRALVEQTLKEIEQHLDIIDGYKDAAAEMKGRKICPACGKAVDRSVSFCPYCGSVCPTPEPEKAEGDVVDTETAEPVEETEEKQAENEAGTEEEKVSTETEKSGQDFPGK